jgi:hypothetical protein
MTKETQIKRLMLEDFTQAVFAIVLSDSAGGINAWQNL